MARLAMAGVASALVAVAGTIAACAPRGSAAGGAGLAGQVTEEPCVGVSATEARCHRLTVYEDRTTERGRTISLRIVVLPATGVDRADDAIVFLAGGPGQAASRLIADQALSGDAFRARRDVVFADQRGTGGSNALTCEFYGPPAEPQSYFDAFLPVGKVRACREALSRTSDLSQYTTSASVEDLESIRVALKYPQLTLVGGSYGTRLAMEYVRRYEPRVRAVVLDGPVTPATHIPERFGQFAAQALTGLLDECLADDACGRAFPAIRDEARLVFDRLRQGAVTATVAHPSAGRPALVRLTREHVAEAIRYLMYSSFGASRVPLYLHMAFNGDFSPIADFLIRWRAAGTFDGLYLSITCAEDVPFVAPDAAERDDTTFLGGYRVREQRAACAEWPVRARKNAELLPVKTAIPVLMTSGTLDPVTPPENGDVLARSFANGLHVRVPSGGHSPAGLNGIACLDELARTFIERGATDGGPEVDTACVSRIARPGFATAR